MRDAESITRRSQQTLGVDAHIMELEVQAAETAHAERIGGRHSRHPCAVHRHEESADAAAAQAGLRRRKDDDQVRGLGVGHPHLAAVERVAAIIEPRDGLLIRRVGPGVLFG